jgi:hypothetical protein
MSRACGGRGAGLLVRRLLENAACGRSGLGGERGLGWTRGVASLARPARTLVRPSAPATITTRGFSSSKPDNNPENNSEEEDINLQRSYRGFFPRLITFLNLSPDDILHYTEALGDARPADDFKLVILATDFKNPLIEKYKFSISDFVRGVPEAIIHIQKALHSKDVCNIRASGMIKQTATTDFLRESVSAHLLPAIFWPLGPGEADFVVTDVEVLKLTILHADTIIVDEVFQQKRIALSGVMKAASALTKALKTRERIAGTSINIDDAFEIDDIIRNSDGSLSAGLGTSVGNHYPLGSVLLHVEVEFETEGSYFKYHKISMNNQVEIVDEHGENQTKRQSKKKWTFEACISGHVEMDWIVSHIH